MTVQILVPANAAPPLAPYSSGTRAGNTVYVSGTLPIGENGETVGIDDVQAQTRHVLESIRKTLGSACTLLHSRRPC